MASEDDAKNLAAAPARLFSRKIGDFWLPKWTLKLSSSSSATSGRRSRECSSSGTPRVPEPAVLDAVDDVARRRLPPPFDDVSFGGVNDDGAFLLAVTLHIGRVLVVAEDLECGDESAFAAVIGPDQHSQPGRRFNDRLPMRHEVVKFDPCDHCTAVREVLLPAIPRRACSAQFSRTCSSLHHSRRRIVRTLLAVRAFL